MIAPVHQTDGLSAKLIANRDASLRLARDAWRYGMVSALALAVDFSTLIFCTRVLGLHYQPAAAIGFISGLGIAYGLSVTLIFNDRRTRARGTELFGFIITGLIGLALTHGLLKLFVEGMGLSLSVSKVGSAGFVFCFNFLSRRILLFTPAAKTIAPVSSQP